MPDGSSTAGRPGLDVRPAPAVSHDPAQRGSASVGSVRRSFAPWTDPAATPLIRFEGVTRRFGDVLAVDDVSLDIFEQRVLLPARAVRVRQDHADADARGVRASRAPGASCSAGEDLSGLPPHRRPVNMMFQSYALFPHMSVEKNIAFGLKQEGMARSRDRRSRRRDAEARPARRLRRSAGRTSSPAASGSGWRWRARWSSGPRCCCSTSRSARSTRSCARRPSSS